MNGLMLRAGLLVTAAALLAGCARQSQTAPPPDAFTVLAGSELKDIEPLLPEIAAATGVTLHLTYTGTISGVEQIVSGDGRYTAAWFSQGKYLALNDTAHHVKASTSTMISPVIFAVKASKAKALGWSGRDVTWKDLAAAVDAGKLRYAMTNPTTSNTGFSAVLGVATAFAGSGDALKRDQVDRSRLDRFFAGQKLTSGSSGWLIDAYVDDQDSLDGIVNYESALISLNKSGRLHEPLTLIYPKDGVSTADYPLMLLDESKRPAYDKLVAFIKSPDFQKKLMESTYRRPVDSSIALSPDFPAGFLNELPFPSSRATVDGLLLAYLNEHRIPAHAIFVLDISGSMEGSRIESVRSAFDVLAGQDQTLTGRFARFDDREHISIITFNDRVRDRAEFTMHGSSDTATLQGVRTFVDGLVADGATAIYDSLEAALDDAAHDGSDRYTSIVLMTDGENNRGENESDFERRYAQRPKKVRIFPIFIGEASPADLEKIAAVSHGRAFDARKERLATIFKEIRGYQ